MQEAARPGAVATAVGDPCGRSEPTGVVCRSSFPGQAPVTGCDCSQGARTVWSCWLAPSCSVTSVTIARGAGARPGVCGEAGSHNDNKHRHLQASSLTPSALGRKLSQTTCPGARRRQRQTEVWRGRKAHRIPEAPRTVSAETRASSAPGAWTGSACTGAVNLSAEGSAAPVLRCFAEPSLGLPGLRVRAGDSYTGHTWSLLSRQPLRWTLN